MPVQLELWQLISLFGALFGAVGGFGKLLLSQFEARLAEKFAAQDAARAEGRKEWDERLRRIEAKQEELERDVRKILIELPREYVRREDYVRNQTLIEAKIDQLSLRIQNWMLGGGNA